MKTYTCVLGNPQRNRMHNAYFSMQIYGNHRRYWIREKPIKVYKAMCVSAYAIA